MCLRCTLNMIEIFWYYLSTLFFIAVLMALLLVYRYYLGNRLIRQTQKLQLQINRIPKEVIENASNPSELLSSGLGGLGIEGIMKELNIDPSILKNPLVKGLVERYAPRIIEQLRHKANGEQQQQLL